MQQTACKVVIILSQLKLAMRSNCSKMKTKSYSSNVPSYAFVNMMTCGRQHTRAECSLCQSSSGKFVSFKHFEHWQWLKSNCLLNEGKLFRIKPFPWTLKFDFLLNALLKARLKYSIKYEGRLLVGENISKSAQLPCIPSTSAAMSPYNRYKWQ